MTTRALLTISCFLGLSLLLHAQQPNSKEDLLSSKASLLAEGKFNEYLENAFQLSDIYLDEGNYDSTIVVLNKATELSYQDKKLDTILASCHHKLGIAYFFNGQDENAITHWENALNLRQALLLDNHIDIIKGYRNIGNAYFELKNYYKSEYYLSLADSLNNTRSAPDEIKEAQLNAELGTTYFKLKDYDKASRHLNIAEKLYENLFGEEPWELNEIYQKIAVFYLEREDGEQMKLYAKKSIDLYNSFDDKYDEDYIELARAYNNLGIAHDFNDDYKEAIGSYSNAISIFQKYSEYEGVLKELSRCHSNSSLSFAKLDKYEDALNQIDKSLLIDRTTDNKLAIIMNLENKADIQLRMGEIDKALISIERSLGFIEELKENDVYLINIPSRVLVQGTKIKILNALYAETKDKKFISESVSLVRDNSNLIDQLRNEFISDASKEFLAKNAKKIIEEGIYTFYNFYLENKNPELVKEAWRLSEKSKSIILLETLRDSKAKKSSKTSDILLIKEDSIKKCIADVENEIYNNPSNSISLNKKYLQLNKELESIYNEIKSDNPRYFDAIKSISKISLEESLNNNQKDILEYFIGKKSSFVFVKENNLISMHPIGSIDSIKKHVELIRKSTIDIFSNHLEKNEKYLSSVETFNNSAFRLYKILIDTIPKNQDLQKNLLIIPDGVLGYLPFDMLISEYSENEKFSSLNYLINKYNISYSYSLALLDEMKNLKKSKSVKNLLAMAPLFENNNEVYFYGQRMVKKENQPPLYFNEEEVEAITEIIGGHVVVGKEASEEYFINHASEYNIIHLSTHGKANDLKGTFSYLAFTEIVDSTENEFVYNYDLYNLNLNADMVVLSACETGLGELKEGEGIISLARGFSYAGAKSIINTLWTINDYRTKEIMESFYTYIESGQRKDEALRNAKLDFIKSNPDDAMPFYWAAFIPIGDMSSIKSTSSINILMYLGLLIIAVFIASLLYRKFKH